MANDEKNGSSNVLEKVPSGIPGFDDITQGGLPREQRKERREA